MHIDRSPDSNRARRIYIVSEVPSLQLGVLMDTLTRLEWAIWWIPSEKVEVTVIDRQLRMYSIG